MSLGEFGPAPRFHRGGHGGRDPHQGRDLPGAPCRVPGSGERRAVHAAARLIGSDVLAHRPDWQVVDNPFGNDDPIVLLPALKPDVALFHAPLADRDGNIWIGRDRELATMAHAAAKTVVTVEKLHDGNLLRRPAARGRRARRLLSWRRSRSRPNGAWPLALADHYPPDAAHLAEYARLAATAEGFAAYLDRYVHAQRAA